MRHDTSDRKERFTVSNHEIVVQSEHLAAEASAWLAGRCRLVECGYDEERFRGVLGDAVGLVVRTYTVVDRALLDAAGKLRVVGRAGSGLDNIDVRGCRERGIKVVYTPGANTQAVVEYVVALLTDVLRPRAPLARPVDQRRWRAIRDEAVAERQMSELSLGILGMGRVGRRLAEVARAIGFSQILYNDVAEIPPQQRFGASPVSVEVLFAQSHVISIHVDGRASNRHLVSHGLVGRMRLDAVLINTSRGFVVDNVALAEFLRARSAARALLDVHECEPFDAGNPLVGLANARLYPHLAACTKRAHLNMSWVVRDVLAVLEERQPEYPAP